LKSVDPQTQGSLHTVGAVLGGLSMITDWMSEVLTEYTSETMILYYNLTESFGELEQPGNNTSIEAIVDKIGKEIDRFNAAWGGKTVKSWVGARLGALSTLTLWDQTREKKFNIDEFRNYATKSPEEKRNALAKLELWKMDAVRKAGIWSTVLWALSLGLGGGTLHLAHTTMFRPEQIDGAISRMVKTSEITQIEALDKGRELATELQEYSAVIGNIFGGAKTKELWQYVATTTKNTNNFFKLESSQYVLDLPANITNILQALKNCYITTPEGGYLWQISLTKAHIAAVSISSGLHVIKSATGVVKAYTSAMQAIIDTLGEKGLYG
jgi:hypothetical protein